MLDELKFTVAAVNQQQQRSHEWTVVFYMSIQQNNRHKVN